MNSPRMLLAGLVLAFSTVSARADVWTFETPSENVQCSVGQEANIESDIICRIIERSGPPALPRPGNCASDWGHTFSMRETGPVELVCGQLNTSRDGFSRADYGVTGEFAGFTCHSSTQGLKCINRDGNGFFLSRKIQSVFNGPGGAVPPNHVASTSSRQGNVSTPDMTNMSYSEARQVILGRGWRPLQNPAPGDLAFVARQMYDHGYVEVDTCSPVGNAPCKFYFRNPGGQYLEVSTSGEIPHVARVEVLDTEALDNVRLTSSTPSGYNNPANISVACNNNGAVVSLPDRSTIYLGKQCDAYKPGVGNGRWWFAASAFLVEVGGQTTRFARDLSCEALPYCRYQTGQAQTDEAARQAVGAVAQLPVNTGSSWSSTPGQGFHIAGISNGAGDRLTLTCAAGGSQTPGSSIAVQIGGSPIKTGTLVEMIIEGNNRPGFVPVLLSHENAFFVVGGSSSKHTFETAIRSLKAGENVTVRVRGGSEAKFSLKGSSAAIGDCKAVPASAVLSAAAANKPDSGSEIVSSPVAERPVTVDANAGLVRSEIAPDYQFVTLDGYALLPETQVERIGGTIQPWITWTTVNFPIVLPQLIEPDLPGRTADADDIYAIAVAHSFLSDAEKSAIEGKLGLPFPLFSEFEGISANRLRTMGGNEGAAASYAEQLIRARDRLDEFTRGPALQEIRSVLRAKIAASKPQLPLPVARIYEVSLGDYDFENGGFPVDGIQRFLDPAASRMSAIAGAARFNTDVMEYPKFIPMEPEAAKRLIEGIAEHRGDRHRVVNMAVFGELTGINRVLQDGGHYPFELSHKVKRIDFGFGDKVLGDVFYSVVPDKLEDAEVDAARQVGGTEPVTLYGPEYLVSAVSDAFPDLLDAQGMMETLMRARVRIENADLAEWGLGNLPGNKILRPELAEPRREPNEDDIRLYRAFLEGRRQAGAGNEITLPVTTWVRQAEDGTKTIEPARPVDLVAHALEQNMGLFGKLRNGGRNRADYLTDLLKDSPHAIEPGRIALAAGNVEVTRRSWSPALFSLKLDKANPNAPLTFEGGLNEPASIRRGTRGVMSGSPRSEGELRGHIVLELEEAPIIVEEHEASESGKAVLFKVALKRVTFIDQGEERILTFDDGQDGGSGDGELPAVPTPAALPLDAETSDLLILRHLPDTVTDADFQRMLLARWEVENRSRDINTQLPWGRFFEIGQAKPERNALDAILPAFRDWSKARAANLPETLQIKPQGFSVSQPRIAGFGSTLANPNLLHSGLRQCESAIRWSQAQNNYPEHKRRMLENACEYIRQASKLPSDVLYFGRTESLPAKWRGKGTSVRAPAHHGTVGLRSECHGDKYCRAIQEAIKSGVFGETVFVLDDVYVFDKAADIRPELNAQTRGTNVRLNVQVAGVERSTQARPSPFAQALMKVDDFIAAQELLERHDSLGDFAPELVDTNFFDIRVVSMELVERKTGRVLAAIPLVDMPSGPDDTLLQPVERVTAAPPSEAYGRDMVGLRLGMSFEEADRIIRDHMDVGRALIADRSWSVRASAGNIDPFSSGVAYESKDGREIIIIHDEPPSASKVVIGAVRQVVFEKGKVSPAQIFAQARDKYGQPDLAEGDSQAWVEDDETNVNCMAFSAAQQRRAIWRDANGNPEQWTPGTFRGGGAPAPMNTERNRLDYRSKCGPGVTITLDTRENRNWDRLVFRLHDAKTLFKHVTQSEIMIREGAGFTGEVAVESENTGIKF